MELDITKCAVETCQEEGLEVQFLAFREVLYVPRSVCPEYQRMNIFIPAAYRDGGMVNGYTRETAPIFMPNTVGGYMPGPLDEPGLAKFGPRVPNSIFLVPMATSLVPDCFEGAERQSMMGLQSSAANIGAMLMTLIGGLLAAIHWSCNYLVYLIALPGLILSLVCLPKALEQGQPAGKNDTSGFLTLLKNPGVLAACLISLIVTMLFNTAPTNLSMLLTENDLGTAAQLVTGSDATAFRK